MLIAIVVVLLVSLYRIDRLRRQKDEAAAKEAT